MMESEELYQKILFENVDKGFQLRLVVNEFRSVQYLHIRKYFLSYDNGYVPSKEGISMPASIHNMYALADGMVELLSMEESVDSVKEHFSDKILDLKKDPI